MIKESAILVIGDDHHRLHPAIRASGERRIDLHQKTLPAIDRRGCMVVMWCIYVRSVGVTGLNKDDLRKFRRGFVLNIMRQAAERPVEVEVKNRRPLRLHQGEKGYSFRINSPADSTVL